MGEGWHNNHHSYQSSVRQGFRWWEYDPTFYVLKALSWVGIVWDMKSPPETVLRNEQRLSARVIARSAEQLAARFNYERIAAALAAALHGPDLTNVRDALNRARDRAAALPSNLHLPQLPTRDEFVAEARRNVRPDPLARRDREPRLRNAARLGRQPSSRRRRGWRRGWFLLSAPMERRGERCGTPLLLAVQLPGTTLSPFARRYGSGVSIARSAANRLSRRIFWLSIR
ncbi:MAG: hypothetical protein WDN69_37840 [Aliidongia sp.]